MNIEQLNTFLEIIRLGSFSEAARSLGISQPAVSFQIQRLEQELGVRLLDRTQRKVMPTAAGKRLFEFSGRTRDDYESMLRDISRLRDEVSGDLVTAASNIPGEYILPPLLADFKKHNPSVNIRMDVTDSQGVIDGIRQGLYEIGFCGKSPDGSDLTAVPFAGDEIVLIAPPSHPFTRRGQINADELYGEQIITRGISSGTRQIFEEHLAAAGLDANRLAFNLILGSTQAVISGVAAGAGVAFVSSLALGGPPSARDVHRIKVKGLEIRRKFLCIYRQEHIDSRLLETFVSFITSLEAGAGG